jgi:hypothetical protein
MLSTDPLSTVGPRPMTCRPAAGQIVVTCCHRRNDQEAFQRVASGRDFSASSRGAAMAGSPPRDRAACPSSRRRSRSWTCGTIVNLDFDQRVWVRSRLMSVRRIRSGICRVEAACQLPGCDHQLPSRAQQASALVYGSGDRAGEVERVDTQDRVGTAAGQARVGESTCWKLARPGPQGWGARSWD